MLEDAENPVPHHAPSTISRRKWLLDAGAGLGGIALAQLLAQDCAQGDTPRADWNGGLHHRAKVRRIVQLFMNGGVSQVDTFDKKPILEKRHGEKIDFGIKAAATSSPGAIMKSPFKFQQH